MQPSDLMTSVQQWLDGEHAIQSAVLFGSSATSKAVVALADGWSDIDLHLVTTASERLEHVSWEQALPSQQFRFQAVRPATGGVRKVTVFFSSGQADLVLVPAWQLRLVRWSMQLGMHRKVRSIQIGLNEISTCVRCGYRFLKGENEWGSFYARIAKEVPGVRVSDNEARNRADVFLSDLLWILQKLERGELSAAQHLLHRSLAETNFSLIRELRLRRGEPLPSFGLGRRVETLLPPHELSWVQVGARLETGELQTAAWRALDGLTSLMRELVPTWGIPPGMEQLVRQYPRPVEPAIR
jgi:hypothetical protein